jgi:peptidoglycan/xylan/chitin deacetylase (PgdA/CDA1 family)
MWFVNKRSALASVFGIGIALIASHRVSGNEWEGHRSSSCQLPSSLSFNRSSLSQIHKKEIEFTNTRELVRFFIESFNYGEYLQSQFDQKIKSGASLKDLRDDAGLYDRLLVLRQIKESVLAQTVEEASKNFVKTGSKDFDFFKKYENELKQSAQKIGESPEVVELALGDISAALLDLGIYTKKCNPEVFGQTAWSKKDQMIRRIRSLRSKQDLNLSPLAVQKYSIKSFIDKKITDQKNAEIEARLPVSNAPIFKTINPNRFLPGNLIPGSPVIYPDAGKPGNVTGYSFPKGVWSLTFDDGPGTTTSGQILDHLKAYGIRATFFVLSEKLLSQPEMSLRALSENHELASHSYTHANIPKLDESARSKEIGGALEVFQNVLGFRPELFRLPYGSGVSIPSVRELIKNEKLIHVFWTVDTLDWQDKDPESIYQRTLIQIKNAGNKGVILFHDIHPQTVIASEKVMKYLKNPAHQTCTAGVLEVVNYLNDLAMGHARDPICNLAR